MLEGRLGPDSRSIPSLAVASDLQVVEPIRYRSSEAGLFGMRDTAGHDLERHFRWNGIADSGLQIAAWDAAEKV